MKYRIIDDIFTKRSESKTDTLNQNDKNDTILFVFVLAYVSRELK